MKQKFGVREVVLMTKYKCNFRFRKEDRLTKVYRQ